MPDFDPLLERVFFPDTQKKLSEYQIQIHQVSDSSEYTCCLGYPCLEDVFEVRTVIEDALKAMDPLAHLDLDFSLPSKISSKRPTGVKEVIGVAACKGGVGKSTVTTNLAWQLKKEGARVGVLDADIYGPNQDILFGFSRDTIVETRDDKYIVPKEIDGIQLMSAAFLMNDESALVWRGPMLSKAIQQLLYSTLWDDIDYLLIDFPPGTGDVQLTLAQKLHMSGIILVTTPQYLVNQENLKTIKMFEKFSIPILGFVENMAYFLCTNCSEKHYPFSSSDQNPLSDLGLDALGVLPLENSISVLSDGGALEKGAEYLQKEYRKIIIRAARKLWEYRLKDNDQFISIKASYDN